MMGVVTEGVAMVGVVKEGVAMVGVVTEGVATFLTSIYLSRFSPLLMCKRCRFSAI